jgi:hypothetical protein
MGSKRKAVILLLAPAVFALLVCCALLPAPAWGAQPSTINIRRVWTEREREETFLSVWLDCFEDGKSVHLVPRDFNKFLAALGAGGKREEAKNVKAQHFEENTAIIFLIDTSKTLNENMFSLAKQGVKKWIERMQNGDHAAIVSFATSTEKLADFTDNTQALLRTLNNVKQNNDKKISLYQAVYDGMAMLEKDEKNFPRRRIVVIFTSGVDGGTGSSNADVLRGAIAKNSIPVYAVLFPYSGPRINDRGPLISAASLRDQFKNIVISDSGGWLNPYNSPSDKKVTPAAQLDETLQELFRRFENLVYMKMDVSRIAGDGKPIPLEITWTDGTRTARGVHEIPFMNELPPPVPVPVPVPIPDPAPDPKPGFPIWIWIALCVTIFGVAGVLFWEKFKKKTKKSTNEETVGPPVDFPQPPGGFPNPPIPPTGVIKNPPPPPREPEIVLTTIAESGHSRTYRKPFHGSITIGRLSSPDILTIQGDEHITRKHCKIFMEGDRFMIQDLDSANGTIVNGAAITKRYPIADGDILVLGTTELRVSLPGAQHPDNLFTQREKL